MVGGKKQRWAEVEQETGRKDTDSGVCLGSNAKKGWGGQSSAFKTITTTFLTHCGKFCEGFLK